jgi:hypothetical protein
LENNKSPALHVYLGNRKSPGISHVYLENSKSSGISYVYLGNWGFPGGNIPLKFGKLGIPGNFPLILGK